MKEDKITNSKLYALSDWMWRLFVLNVLTLITSLPIITILPSITACFSSIKDANERSFNEIIRNYFANFKLFFKETIVLSIIIVAVIGISFYGYLWYQGVIEVTKESSDSSDSFWAFISLIAIVVLTLYALTLLMVLIQLPIVTNYFNIRATDKVRMSFFMTFKFFGTAVLETLVVGISLYISVTSFLKGSFLVIYSFMYGISLPLFFVYKISYRIYTYLSNKQSELDELEEASLKDIEVTNRETYEDNNKTNKEEKNG